MLRIKLPIYEPRNTGITHKGQTSKNIDQEESLLNDTIAGIASPNTLNKIGYNFFNSELLILSVRAITKENIGITR